MRKCGIDAVAVTGMAVKPVYIYVEDDESYIHDASHLWGKDSYETEDWLYKKVEVVTPYWDCKDILELPKCSDEEKGEFGGRKCHYCGAKYLCDEVLNKEK